jgi:hypothetical protein
VATTTVDCLDDDQGMSLEPDDYDCVSCDVGHQDESDGFSDVGVLHGSSVVSVVGDDDGDEEQGGEPFPPLPQHPNEPFHITDFEPLVRDDHFRVVGPLEVTDPSSGHRAALPGLFVGMHVPTETPVVYKLCGEDREWVHHMTVQYCPESGDYHPHIIRLYGVFRVSPDTSFASYYGDDSQQTTTMAHTRVMVLQQSEGDLITLYGQVSPTTTLAHVASALQHLHSCHEWYPRIAASSPLSRLYMAGTALRQLSHNDVKPENLFAIRVVHTDGTVSWTVSLADFGGLCHRGDVNGICTDNYAAPEVVSGRRFTPAADIFGLAASIALGVSGRMIAGVVRRGLVPRHVLMSLYVRGGFSRRVAVQLVDALDTSVATRPLTLAGLE